MSVMLKKKDYTVCDGCFCTNTYCVPVDGCAMSELKMFLCMAGDGACLPVQENIPQNCAYLWFTCYPKVGCCMTLEKLYADQPDVLAKYSDFKKDKPLMGALCIPGCLAENAYGPFAPTTCCEDDLSTFLCIGADSAFPCNEKIPNTFSCCCPGLFLSPKCACCPKLGDLIGEDKFEVPSNPELAPVVAGEVVDRT